MGTWTHRITRLCLLSVLVIGGRTYITQSNRQDMNEDTMARRRLSESEFSDAHSFANFKSPYDYLFLFGAILLIVLDGFGSTLFFGYMELDAMEIELKSRAGTPEEKRMARLVQPLITDTHRLSVTLTMFTCIFNEALPLFLDRLVPPYISILLSVLFVLTMGEVIPVSLMKKRELRLRFTSRFAGFLRFLMWFATPIAYPLIWILNRLLGHDQERGYSRAELATLVRMQKIDSGRPQFVHKKSYFADELGPHETPNYGKELPTELGQALEAPLTNEEVKMVEGLLLARDCTVESLMKPLQECYSMSASTPVTLETVIKIAGTGYSRILVYEGVPNNIRGFIHLRRLVTHLEKSKDPSHVYLVSDLKPAKPAIIKRGTDLHKALKILRYYEVGLALISDSPGDAMNCLQTGAPLEGPTAVVGMLTLNDVLSHILKITWNDKEEAIRALVKKELMKMTTRRVSYCDLSDPLNGGVPDLSISKTDSSWVAEEVTMRLQSLHDFSTIDRVHGSSTRAYDSFPESILERTPSFSGDNESTLVFTNAESRNVLESTDITTPSQMSELAGTQAQQPVQDTQICESQTTLPPPEDIVRNHL